VLSRSSLTSLAGAVAIFLFIRIFLVAAYRIPSGSMEPTLLVGDFLFVNEVIYGAHIPFTSINLPGFTDPRRGSIAVYQSPSQATLPPGLQAEGDTTPTVVKRLVGAPSDTIYMRDGLLYVDGIAQRQGYGAAIPPLGWKDAPDSAMFWMKRVELRGSRFGAPPAQPSHDNWGPIVVPPKHYFSLGDNRYNSVDARYYGFIPRENIRGKPMIIYMSLDMDDWRIRWNRLGQLIR
jgi:signal peptidase I